MPELGRKRAVRRTEVLDEMRSRGGSEPWTATELADTFDVTNPTIYDRLAELRELGLVDSKRVGSRARVWWVTADGEDT